MSWLENEAFEQMYERAGFMATDDGALVMLAGSTLGGGKQQTHYPHVRCIEVHALAGTNSWCLTSALTSATQLAAPD